MFQKLLARWVEVCLLIEGMVALLYAVTSLPPLNGRAYFEGELRDVQVMSSDTALLRVGDALLALDSVGFESLGIAVAELNDPVKVEAWRLPASDLPTVVAISTDGGATYRSLGLKSRFWLTGLTLGALGVVCGALSLRAFKEDTSLWERYRRSSSQVAAASGHGRVSGAIIVALGVALLTVPVRFTGSGGFGGTPAIAFMALLGFFLVLAGLPSLAWGRRAPNVSFLKRALLSAGLGTIVLLGWLAFQVSNMPQAETETHDGASDPDDSR